jgi:hypothetical protein
VGYQQRSALALLEKPHPSVTLPRRRIGSKWSTRMATFIDIAVFVFVIAMFVFLPYLGNYGVLVFVCLFGFSYLSRRRPNQNPGRR